MINNSNFYILLQAIVNLIDVLFVIVPVLLAVAFMTIIERKQLAAHQRRVGPNTVGRQKNKLKKLGNSKRSYHSSSSFNCCGSKCSATNLSNNSCSSPQGDKNSHVIDNLYKNRTAPVKPFYSNIVDTCDNLSSVKQRNLFFKKYNKKGGIYLFQYKNNANIYYIGRTNNFKNRLNAHLKTRRKDKFHLFTNFIGWDNFSFSIIEVCDLNIQKVRENFYLNKYLPLLNTLFKSNLSEFHINESLYKKLKEKQIVLKLNKIYMGIPVYLYTFDNEKLSKNFTKYDSINTLSQNIKISRTTIRMYLNSHVPFKNYLFFTNVVNDLNLTNDSIYKSKEGLNLNGGFPKKVFAYNIKGEVLQFKSREEAARFLNVQSITIRNHIDKWVIGGVNGYYLFSQKLGTIEKNKVIKMFNLRKTNNIKIWAYEANNLNSVYKTFDSMQKAADYFNIDYRTILRHLDTNKSTIKNGKLVLFFSKNIFLDAIKSIKVKNVKNETHNLWVYKKINNELILINKNQPTFNSKSTAAKELKMSHKTITKYLNTNKSYNDLFFYSEKFTGG